MPFLQNFTETSGNADYSEGVDPTQNIYSYQNMDSTQQNFYASQSLDLSQSMYQNLTQTHKASILLRVLIRLKTRMPLKIKKHLKTYHSKQSKGIILRFI